MNPVRHNRDLPGQEQQGTQNQGIPSIWSSIGRLKTELRLMGHRLQNVGEETTGRGQHQPYTFSLASLVDGASGGIMPGVALSNEQSSAASKPTSQPSPVHLSSRHRISSRTSDDKVFENGTTEQTTKRLEPRGESRPPSSRSREDVRSIGHGLREDSPRRVDFSRTHQLREVNWDGTYQDSLAYPTDIHGTSTSNSNNTTTTSRDLRETDIHFLNFSHIPGSTVVVEGATSSSSSSAPPAYAASAAAAAPGGSHTSLYAPPPSVSNSVTNCNLFLPSSPPSSSSSFTYTSTSSSSSPPVTHHRPTPQQHTHQSPDVRWAGGVDRKVARGAPFTSTRVFGKTSSSSSGSKNIGSRLAHVDLQPAGSARTSSSSSQSPGPSLAELKRRELLQLRKHVEEKWASANNIISVPGDANRHRPGGNAPHVNSEAMDAQGAQAHPLFHHQHHSQGEMETARLNRLETIPGNSPGVKPLSVAEGAVGGPDFITNSPKRPLPIKMPITADLKEDEIILKLKERLKHQRALASISSTNTSNDTSFANSSDSSAQPPALPPRHPLINDTTPRVTTRKVAASHPSPSYRGFSGIGSDQQTPSSKSNTKCTGVKKKPQNLKKPVLQTKKQDTELASQNARHLGQTPVEKPKKVSRVVASGDKKSKPSKNIITTSTWRNAQEILKELGLASKGKSKPTSEQADDLNKTVTLSDHERQNQMPDGAEADITDIAGHHSDDVTDTRHLSQEAKSVLNDIQSGLSDPGTKPKTVFKPAVKRKAPKTSEPEKLQQPSEKTRHYDQESVRKFIAEQKAKRLKKQLEEKMANKKAHEKKQQMLQELVERQKKQAVKSAALGRQSGDGDRKRKRDDKDDMNANKENIHQDHDDNSTLTADSADDSTPHITPRDIEEQFAHQKKSKEKAMDVSSAAQNQTASVFVNSSANCDSQEAASSKQQPMDVDSILDRFSQVVNQRRKQEMGSSSGSLSSGSRQVHMSEFKLQSVFSGKHYGDETAFAIGTSNSIARTNEKRKEAIKATALTLQSKLAEERRRLEDVHILDTSHQLNSTSDYVSRYTRLTGSRDDYTVFNMDLPGSKHYSKTMKTPEDEVLAATRIQAAYRGHNVRQALNWELPSGQTFGQRLRGNIQTKVNKTSHSAPDEDASELSETSTFSDVTRTEPSGGLDLVGNRKSGNAGHHRNEASSRIKPTPATYKPPSQYTWVESKPDPYSVMSVFSRQNKYLAAGSRQADMPHRTTATTITVTTTTTTSTTNSAFITAPDVASQNKPLIMSVEKVTVGQLENGQPVVAKSRYTRVEAIVSDQDNSDLSSTSRSESPVRQSRQVASHISIDAMSKSEPAYTMTYESYGSRKYYSDSSLSSNDEDDEITSVKKSAGYKWQMSDAGVETDVSQMSEDEPRRVRSKLESATARPEFQDQAAAVNSRGAGDRLSPNSLANKFSANLNYLESMEESLRHVVGMERTRGICLAQQESVSLAQVLKARQQEHSADLQALQLQVKKEAVDATQQSVGAKLKSGRSPASGTSVASLLNKEDNLRPESRSHVLSRSSGQISYSTEDLSQSPGNRRTQRSSGATSVTGKSKGTKTSATLSVETAEDSQNSSQNSIKTAEDSQDHHTATTISEVITKADDSYTLSFDESLTDEESFRQVLPSESHRKEVRRHSGEFKSSFAADASHLAPMSDLSSLFAGEDSFTKFTAEMVRQIMREEEYRAQHQAALLSLRQKALQEKAKAELAWLQQLKQKPHNKGADDVFPNIDKREKKIKQNLMEQQAEIRRLQEANKIASKERQLILQQHEEIAKIKQNTQATLQKFKVFPSGGRLARPAEVHTEDETEATTTDVTEEIKDSKSDSEVYKDKSPAKQENSKTMEKQQKMRLDVKYMTAREQRLHERKKQAKELLEWKKRLDAEEQKVYQLEKKAIQAWESKNAEKKLGETSAKKASKVASPSKKDDSNVISNRILSSIHDELDGVEQRSRTIQGSISEVISTQLSAAESLSEKKTRSDSNEVIKTISPVASGSESSIPEDIPTGSRNDKQKAQDSGDDTAVHSAAIDDYPDTFEHEMPSSMSNRRKSPVGKLLPQGNSPLPSPWSRKPGSESESEDSISHTETLSDASDYEARIRQLSDELRRRRKEVEILKKERSRRQKEKFKAQEEALKKQLEAYNNYIQQLKLEKDELEHEPQTLKTAVKPQIKQPHVGHHSKVRSGHHGDEAASNSSSFEEVRDSPDSNHVSPKSEGRDVPVSSGEEKSKKKSAVSLMDRISEGSESVSDRSSASVAAKATKKEQDESSTSSVQEMIEEVETNTSEKTPVDVLDKNSDKVADKLPAAAKDDETSYTLDFSDMPSSLAQSHSKVPLSARSQGSLKLPTDSEISEHIEDPVSAKSASLKSHPKLDSKTVSNADQEKVSNADSSVSDGSPVTGIQESDSDETESRGHSYRKSESSSRPSSERSTVSNVSYTDIDDDVDIVSSGSEKTPVRSSQRLLPDLPAAASVRTEDDISEQITASLPSISDRQKVHSASYKQSQDVLDSLLGYNEEENELEDDDEDKTPVATPREMAQTPVPGDEENASLLLTDPLVDFHLGDRVVVFGHSSGVLRFKGKVEFSPGIWAGVELEDKVDGSDGFHHGKRYFTCPAGRGVLVQGSEISAEQEKLDVNLIVDSEEDLKSPDESLVTDHEEILEGDKTALIVNDTSLVHSTPLSSPYSKDTTKPDTTPVKRDMTLVADTITDHLTMTIIKDSVSVMGKVGQKKMSQEQLSVKQVDLLAEPKKDVMAETKKSSSVADQTTDTVMKSLLEEAIADMFSIKRRKLAASHIHDSNSSNHLVNGHIGDKDLISFVQDKVLDNDSGLSLEPIYRPSSPVPGNQFDSIDHKLSDELNISQDEYIDDDCGLDLSDDSVKPPPPYPGPGGVGLVRQLEEVTPVVPLTKEAITPIISRAVDIYWNNRRYGESLEGVAPPSDFLSEDEEDDHQLTSKENTESRKSWKKMLFDLTGEIIRDIYQNEDKPEPPVWQKIPHQTQRFFKGNSPPTTVDALRPVVQSAVFKELDLNGTRKALQVNKWNIRKKKDMVDAVLSLELAEDERGWVDYTTDEMNLKMNLTNSIFDSLISETVQTVNGIYQRRPDSHM